MGKIYLIEHQFNDILLPSLINEIFNYHVGNLKDLNNIKPYRSDNKNIMRGRDTGHFGSGIYFSTYQGKYDHVSPNSETPNLIQVKDGVYRVDFDLYKNLYRVNSGRQGDMLFNTLKNVNHIYYKVESGNFDCSREYSIISRNSDALGLNCPSYRELLKMARDHVANESDFRSFSTVFMEYNGFNGVNVSGISKYDNTLHGSVIYDMSKVDRDSIRKVNVKYNKIPFMDSSVASDDEMDDVAYDALTDKSYISLPKLSKLPEIESIRVLKNYPRVLDNLKSMPYYFNDKFIDRYLRILFTKIKQGKIKNPEVLCLQGENADFLYERKAFYFANLMPFDYNSAYGSLLLRFIRNAVDYEVNPMPIINEILSFVNRDLTSFEKEIIKKWSMANNITIPVNETTIRKIVHSALDELSSRSMLNNRKMKQCQLILKTNPPFTDYSTWVRTPEDILSFQEMFNQARLEYEEYGELIYPDLDWDVFQNASENRKIMVFSSYPIKTGVFVSPSRICAEGYAMDKRVFSKVVSVDDVAWIDFTEGQYAPIH